MINRERAYYFTVLASCFFNGKRIQTNGKCWHTLQFSQHSHSVAKMYPRWIPAVNQRLPCPHLNAKLINLPLPGLPQNATTTRICSVLLSILVVCTFQRGASCPAAPLGTAQPLRGCACPSPALLPALRGDAQCLCLPSHQPSCQLRHSRSWSTECILEYGSSSRDVRCFMESWRSPWNWQLTVSGASKALTAKPALVFLVHCSKTCKQCLEKAASV